MKVTAEVTFSEYDGGRHYVTRNTVKDPWKASVAESMDAFGKMLRLIAEAKVLTGTKLRITIETVKE